MSTAQQLHDRMARFIETGEIPGLVTAVADGGHTSIDAIGALAFGGPAITREAIFRISSMSKPVTAAAVMVLVDDGVVALDAPIERWLPELANRRVLRRIDGELDDTVAAVR